MMEFLRGLAPQHANGPGSAVAALPPRFASEQPLRAVAARAVSVGPEDEHEVAARRVVAHPPAEPIGSAPSHSARETKTISAAEPAAIEPHSTDRGRPVESMRLSKAPPAAIAARPAIESPTNAEPAGARSRVRDTHDVPLPEVHPARAATANPAPAIPAPAAVPVLRDVRSNDAPVSRDRLAARVDQRAGGRPVVHVTIDRIDVRMPPSPERPKPPARSRSTSSSASLTEYLRSRPPGRRGGSS